jgi:acyl-CoA reductase-like NAD-dependent aldehyde dehydrogenase
MQASSALASSRWNGRIFNGAWIEPRGGGHDVLEKATGSTLTHVGIATPADIAVAAKTAAAAQPGWAATPPAERLSTAVISRSVGRAMAIAERLQSGIVHINDQTVNDESTNPFGGRGASGNGGSMGGPSDLDEYTTWRWITIKDEAPAYPF